MPDAVCQLYRRATTTGDEEAWRQLVATCQPEIRRRLRGLIGRLRLRLTVAESDEMLQDLWCRVVGLPEPVRFRGAEDAELWAWLQSILRRLVLDAARRRSAAKRSADLVGEAWSDEDGSGWQEQVPSPSADPEERLLLREAGREVERACREVTRPVRRTLCLRILRLSLIEGLSSLDIARRLRDIDAGQVDRLVFRLRRRLAERGLFLPHRAAFGAT